MTSTRLPGKVLKKILNKELLLLQIERLKLVTLPVELIIATTSNQSDNLIVGFCELHGIKFFRGSESDVLSRYYHAAKENNANIIVRITSDCPLIDPSLVSDIINTFKNSKYDYVSNTLERSYPRGLDCEVFSFSSLQEAFLNADQPLQREHVTPYIYQNPSIYNLKSIVNSQNLSHLRWTVDTYEDLDLINKIYNSLYPQNPNFTTSDVIKCLELNSDWLKINAHIEQKKLDA